MTGLSPVVVSIAGNQNDIWETNQEEVATNHANYYSKYSTSIECTLCHYTFNSQSQYAEHCRLFHENLVNNVIENSSRANGNIYNFFVSSKPHEIININYSDGNVKKSENLPYPLLPLVQHSVPLENNIASLQLRNLASLCITEQNQKGRIDAQSYICNLCSMPLPTYHSLRKHLIIQHKEGQIINCEKCDESFFSTYDLQMHTRIKRHFVGWYCNPCNVLLQQVTEYIHHGCQHKEIGSPTWKNLEMVIGNEDRVWQCQKCYQLFFGPNAFQNHTKNCILKCPYCSEIFSCLKKFIAHEAACIQSTISFKQSIKKNFVLKCEKDFLKDADFPSIFPVFALCNNCQKIICTNPNKITDHDFVCKGKDLHRDLFCIFCKKIFINSLLFKHHHYDCVKENCSDFIVLHDNLISFHFYCKTCEMRFNEQEVSNFFTHLLIYHTSFPNLTSSENVSETFFQNNSIEKSENTSSNQRKRLQNTTYIPLPDSVQLIPVQSYSVSSEISTDSNINACFTEMKGSKTCPIKNVFTTQNVNTIITENDDFKKCSWIEKSLNEISTNVDSSKPSVKYDDNESAEKKEVAWGTCKKCKINFIPIKKGICYICHDDASSLKDDAISLKDDASPSETFSGFSQNIDNSNVNVTSYKSSLKCDDLSTYDKNTVKESLREKKQSVQIEMVKVKVDKEAEITRKMNHFICYVCGHNFNKAADFQSHPCEDLLKFMTSCFVRIEKCELNAFTTKRNNYESISMSIGLRSKESNYNRKNAFTCDYCNVCFENQSEYDFHACFLSDKELISILHSSSILQGRQKQKDWSTDNSKSVKKSRTDKFKIFNESDLTQYEITSSFQCLICPAVFPSQKLLEWHVRTHNEYRPHICPVCQSRFKRSSNLKEHLRFFHLKGRVPCLKCDKVFANSTKLREHSRIHTIHYNWTKRKIKNRISVEMITDVHQAFPQNLEAFSLHSSSNG